MRNQLPIFLAVVSSALLVGETAQSQSAYFQAVTNLAPATYWPLQETAQPPIADVETNYGSLGLAGNAYYSSTNLFKGRPGAVAGDNSVTGSGSGAFLGVPLTFPGVSLPVGPFTVEAWILPTNFNNSVAIMGQAGPNPGGVNGTTNMGGWVLSQNYLAYADNANTHGFSFHVYNGSGNGNGLPHGGAEADTFILYTNNGTVWYHLVGVFDGVNCTLYINTATNYMTNQIPMTGSYYPDTWDPLTIGCGRGLNANAYSGGIDEVAIYTNALTAEQVTNHYNAKSSFATYNSVVMADQPYMYWHMDAPAYTPPAISAYPVANNYGVVGNVNGLYLSGTTPGLAGPPYAAFGSPSYGCGFNGLGTDATNGISSGVIVTNLNPLMNELSNNISVVAWFKGNPEDSRFQTMLGHSDSSWRISLDGGASGGPGKVHWNPGEGGELTSSGTFNDGQWHMVAGLYLNAGAVATGENFLYVDGVLNGSSLVSTAATGSTTNVLLGGAPDYFPGGNNGSYRNRFFAGSLAHVAYFTNALTAAQIQSLYWLVNPPPAIQTQPTASVTNSAGATNLWIVSVSGVTNLAYQWYYNGSASYSGATALTDTTLGSGTVVSGSATATLSAGNLHASDNGYYFFVVTNNFGSATSTLSQLTLLTAPVITAQSPTGAFSLTNCMTGTASVTVAGGIPLIYQWYTNGTADTSAGNGSTYTISDVQLVQSGETYQCIITNVYGSATSSVATLSVTPLPSGVPASPFAANLVALKPAFYYPLEETVQPPANDVEINHGSLGAAGNAVYSSVNASKGFTPAATSDGDTAVSFGVVQGGGNGRFLAVPPGNPGVVLPAGAFTVEAWVYPTNYSREGIAAQCGVIGSGGINASANSAGWSLTENDVPSLNNSSVGWSFHVYNGNGSTGPSGGAEAALIMPYNLQQWYHVVGVFDGVNCTLYVNGTSATALAAANPATTTALIQPMTGSQAIDTWDQLTIGCAREINNNDFLGAIDEVAVYTYPLTQSQVQAHYAAAFGGSYASTISGDSPYMYWRMDAPAYTAPSQSSYPVANNYGSVGNVATVGGTLPSLYGTACQPGVPGPQFSGMSDPQSGNNNSYGVLINGIGGANGGTANVAINGVSVAEAVPIEIGTNNVLNPTATNAFGNTVAIWFKANPSDNRFQNICGHSDSSWRLALDATGHVNFKGGNNGTQIASARVYADGNWHQAVATWGITGVGWNLYVDGVLDSTAALAASQAGSTNDVFIGGDPQYLNAGNGPYTSNPSNNTAYQQRNLDGAVAQFAFFTNVLSAAQVQTLYSAAGVPPAILSQPATGRVNPAPLYLFFGTTASGSATLAYQWYFNPSPSYAGATRLVNDGVKYALVNTLQMTVSNLVNSDSGYYFVVVTNNYGSVTSALASLVINDQPVITAAYPTNAITLYQGQTRVFSVTASSAVGVNYLWLTNGVADPNSGVPGYVYTLGPVSTAMSGETVRCIVSNGYGSATNDVALTVLPLPAIPAALTNAPFGSNVLALHPTAYWPMHEAEAPLPGWQRDIETNYGTLGSLATAFYGDWKVNNGAPSNSVIVHQSAGALTGSQANPSAFFSATSGSYAVIPRTSPLTTIKPPFTLEAWVKPMNDSFGIILGCGNLTTNRGPAANDAGGGFDWLWGGSVNTFSITMRSGPTNTSYAATAIASTEPKTTANYYPGQWYHLVTTYDGTNIAYYINGNQDSLQNSSAASFNPNTWQPLTIGGGRWTGSINNQFQGYIDELAVYTNLLTPDVIQQHYNDGSNPNANYMQDVLTQNPILYYRMDSLPYVEPALSAWPVLTNYGSVGVQGVYRPSVAPGGIPGPTAGPTPVTGLSANTAMQCDGMSAFADVGTDLAFNPTGKTPFTVAAWEKANPADAGDRGWQTFVGHSDGGWRLVIDGNTSGGTNFGVGDLNFNAGPGGGTDIGNTNNNPATVLNSKAFINDGTWHYVVGTWDGSNELAYVDGGLVESNRNTSANITGSLVDVFLGGYPGQTVYNDVPTATRNEVGRVLAGNMCEAAFWNGVVLQSNQVSQLYVAAGVPPILGAQPISASANENSAFTNSITVTGGVAPFSYQWFENGSPRSGLTNAILVLNPVQQSDASTNWYVVVTNNYASVTSVVWSLAVFSVPTITQNITLTNLVLFAGGHAALSVVANGALPLHYQWYSNSVSMASATNNIFNLVNAQPPNTTQLYYCLVTNSPGSAASSTVSVTILPLPAASYPQTILQANPISFWRLNESGPGFPNDGVTAFDYWGGNNGSYTNTLLGEPGYNPNEPDETSAYFGNVFQDGEVYGIPTNVDFSAPATGNSSFSVEVWAKGYQQLADAGIVSKGYGGGGEQFNLDCGSDTTNAINSTPHSFRFFVRDAGGATHTVASGVNPLDVAWHYLVGVCDETNGFVAFYIDGVLIGTNAIAPGSGILSSSRNMLIGSRPPNATGSSTNQFVGWIDDVAVYNRALSAQEVANHFNAADIPATVTVQPADVTVCQNGTGLLTAAVEGTPPLLLQWYDEGPGFPIPGATNTTLVVNNVQANDSYHFLVTNPYGTNQSRSATMNVATYQPQVNVQPQAQYFVLRGGTISIPATVVGTLRMTNQWQISDTNAVTWTNLTDNARITGSQQIWVNMTNSQPSSLTIANAQSSDAGDYELTVTNAFGSTVTTVANLVVGSMPVSFNGSGLGWSTNQTGTFTTPFFSLPGLLELTDNGGSQARSFFFQYPQYIGAFKAFYTYQASGNKTADGMAFVLQNDPRGPAAIGGAGGALGVSTITPSWELELNLYSGNSDGVGCGIFTNGANGVNTLGLNVAVGSGDPIDFSLNYASGLLALTMTDELHTNLTYSSILNVGDLTKLAGGSTAYVGFTAATGGSVSIQTITNFSFVSIPTETLSASGNSVVIAWPGSISGYVLQQNANLSTTNWVTVTNLDSVVDNLHQVAVPITNSNLFYRLFLP